MTDILDLLAEANPIPAEIPLAAHIADRGWAPPSVEDRRQLMQTTTLERQRTRTRLVPLVAGLVVVAATIGIVMAVGSDDVPVVSSPERQIAAVPDVPPTVDPLPLVGAAPVRVVEMYFDWLSSADLSAALALHSDEFRSRPWPGIAGDGSPGELVAKWSLYFVALRGHMDHDCGELSDGVVLCAVTATDDLSRAMGVESPVYEWEIEVADGFLQRGLPIPGISSTGMPDYGQSEYGTAIAAFDGWARELHTDEFLDACRGQSIFPSWSVDCARFRLQHVDQFVADRN